MKRASVCPNLSIKAALTKLDTEAPRSPIARQPGFVPEEINFEIEEERRVQHLTRAKCMLTSPVVWTLLMSSASPLLAQATGGTDEPVTSFLTRLVLLMTGTWAKLLVIIGLIIWAASNMLSDSQHERSVGRIILCGIVIIGAQALTNYWFSS
jgi:type IV secretory pathway VirB2 component (pilin)